MSINKYPNNLWNQEILNRNRIDVWLFSLPSSSPSISSLVESKFTIRPSAYPSVHAVMYVSVQLTVFFLPSFGQSVGLSFNPHSSSFCHFLRLFVHPSVDTFPFIREFRFSAVLLSECSPQCSPAARPPANLHARLASHSALPPTRPPARVSARPPPARLPAGSPVHSPDICLPIMLAAGSVRAGRTFPAMGSGGRADGRSCGQAGGRAGKQAGGRASGRQAGWQAGRTAAHCRE